MKIGDKVGKGMTIERVVIVETEDRVGRELEESVGELSLAQ